MVDHHVTVFPSTAVGTLPVLLWWTPRVGSSGHASLRSGAVEWWVCLIVGGVWSRGNGVNLLHWRGGTRVVGRRRGTKGSTMTRNKGARGTSWTIPWGAVQNKFISYMSKYEGSEESIPIVWAWSWWS